MMEYHPSRAVIPPVPEEISSPVWSVMIPTYHCARFLPQTLASVLAQDPGPEMMQIEVVDDHSTCDAPHSIVKEIGRGRVGFYQHGEHVGIIKNLDTCLKRSRGKLIHLLHGDDYVRDGFYQKMQEVFEASSEIGAAFCRQIFMDEHGHWQSISTLEQAENGILKNWLERIAVEQRIMTPSIVVRRDVYEKLGGFDSRLICSEDWEMWIRIAAHYPVGYQVEPLAAYRMHSDSNTGRHIRTGEDIFYTRMAIEISKSYLPTKVADKLSSRARETYALSALGTAHSMLSKRDIVAAIAQSREALKCSCSWKVIRQVVRLCKWAGAGWIRQRVAGKVTLS
jgi:glycosyltransferase involved in cell wall biosynthesis